MNTHEEYIECLHVLGRYEEVERADANYKEQMLKKATVDNEIETWKFKFTSIIEKRENDLKSFKKVKEEYEKRVNWLKFSFISSGEEKGKTCPSPTEDEASAAGTTVTAQIK